MNVEIACTIRARLMGLCGRDALDGALMLVPCNDIHTFAMRHAIDVAFVAADGVVLETHRDVLPNHRLRNKRAVATFERFASEETWFCPGDRIRLNVRSSHVIQSSLIQQSPDCRLHDNQTDRSKP